MNMAVNKQSFAKKFAENGQRTVWEDPQYKLGWDMVGIRPPTKEQFNYLFYNIDEKMAFLLEEIDAGGSVKTTGNQEIAGDKTFTGLTTLKKGAIVADSVGDFNANQYLQIGSNNVNSYFYNKRSGKYLSMRNDGELRYDGKRLLNVDDLAGMIPSGAVMYFAGQTAPTGWLKANGAAVSRTTYTALFAAIGTTYGAGDGRSTFNLPDLRGEFVRGWDDGRGVDNGRVFGSAQADEFKAHTHGGVPQRAGDSDRGGSVSWFSIDGIGQTEAAGGSETRPRNIALLACIKI